MELKESLWKIKVFLEFETVSGFFYLGFVTAYRGGNHIRKTWDKSLCDTSIKLDKTRTTYINP